MHPAKILFVNTEKEKLKECEDLLLALVALALERFLDHLDEFAKSAEEGAEAEAPALDADGVDEEVDLRGMLA